MLKTPTRLLVTYTALALVLASCGDAQLESNDAELPQAVAAAETPASTSYARRIDRMSQGELEQCLLDILWRHRPG